MSEVMKSYDSTARRILSLSKLGLMQNSLRSCDEDGTPTEDEDRQLGGDSKLAKGASLLGRLQESRSWCCS